MHSQLVSRHVTNNHYAALSNLVYLLYFCFFVISGNKKKCSSIERSFDKGRRPGARRDESIGKYQCNLLISQWCGDKHC